MWCSQLRFPSFAVTPNGRRPHTNAFDGRAMCALMNCTHSFSFIQKMKENTEFVIATDEMRTVELHHDRVMDSIKKKEKRTWINVVHYSLMSYGFKDGSWKKTRHILNMFALVIRLAFESTVCRPFTWTSRCVLRNAFSTLCTPTASKPSFTSYSCHRTIVLSTFQINWAVRKFADNIWSRRCGNQ